MRFYHKLCVILVALALASSINTASAAPAKWYKVEMLVFSHLTPAALKEEQWPFVKSQNFAKRKLIHLNYGARNTLRAYRLLPRAKFTLNKAAYKIKNTPGYQVLMHIAWIQPIMNSRFKIPIHIYGGNAYNSNGSTTSFSSNEGTPYYNQSNWQLDGTVNISVMRYFNVQFNLLFKEPLAELNALATNNYFRDLNTGLVNFRLLQTRRTRSKELNYIDFPLYGILFKITRLKQA